MVEDQTPPLLLLQDRAVIGGRPQEAVRTPHLTRLGVLAVIRLVRPDPDGGLVAGEGDVQVSVPLIPEARDVGDVVGDAAEVIDILTRLTEGGGAPPPHRVELALTP